MELPTDEIMVATAAAAVGAVALIVGRPGPMFGAYHSGGEAV